MGDQKIDFSSPLRQARRILFIRTDRMGDVLMNLPAIHLLRQTFEKSWITLLTDSSVAGLFKNQPDIDELMTVDSRQIKTDVKARRELILKIKKAGFDRVIISNPDKFYHWAAFAARIPKRIGHDRKWGFLLTHRLKVIDPERDSRHEIEKNLDLVRLVSDKAWDECFSIGVDAQDAERVQKLLQKEISSDKKILVIHAGTSNPHKRWPAECFAETANRLAERHNLQVILIGGAEEVAASSDVARLMKTESIDWTGRLNLGELAAFLSSKKASALLSADSGPVHVAWMGGTPVVALYAKNAIGSDPKRWGPRDSLSRVIFKPIQDISVEEVCAEVDRILSR